MLCRAYAKINLGLVVRGVRADGYHNIETLFYPVRGLYDNLDVKLSESEGLKLVLEGLDVGCDIKDNILYRTYIRMSKFFLSKDFDKGDQERGLYPSLNVRLHKRIPVQAGLGGGSSDATTFAVAMNELLGLGLSRSQLVNEIKHIGADCPFFLYNGPCIATGVGDILRPVSLSLSGLKILIVKPSLSVSTREAYADVVPCEEEVRWPYYDSSYVSFFSCLPPNDFELSVFDRYPLLEEIKHEILSYSPLYCSMSGSGSAIFGIFDPFVEVLDLVEVFRSRGYFTHVSVLS